MRSLSVSFPAVARSGNRETKNTTNGVSPISQGGESRATAAAAAAAAAAVGVSFAKGLFLSLFPIFFVRVIKGGARVRTSVRRRI